MQATSPSKLTDFEVMGRLGSGSFGTVYKVRRKADGLVYVLKAIIIEGMSTKEQLEAINEVKIMASLDHPNCVRYFDSFLDGGRLNIIMEYCNGGDLQLFLKRHSKEKLRVSEERIWRVFLQIAIGLHYLHKQRVLHRDMKSANVFLCKDASVKIGDLGVARVLGTNTNFAKTCVGTPYYLSPELCEDKPYNQKSDVWALGCILYECLTLKHPFDARNQGALILKIIQGHYPPVNGSYSPEIRQLVNRLLSRDSRRRPFVIDLLALPTCVTKAEELGIALPDDVMAHAAEKSRGRPGGRMRGRTTLTLNTGASPKADAPRKPPSGRSSGRAPRGAVRGNRVRRGVPERRPKPQELSVEARTAAMASRGSSTGRSVASYGSRASTKPPSLRFSPSGKLLSTSEVADAHAVAALPECPSPTRLVEASPSGRTHTKPSASDLAALTSTLRVSDPSPKPAAGGGGGVVPRDGHMGVLASNQDADGFDAIMQANFEENVALKSPERAPAVAPPEAAEEPVTKPKKVLLVKRVPPGAPKDFWDPVDPTKLPDLPAEIPAGFWEPHHPRHRPSDVDVSISAVEVSSSGSRADMESGGTSVTASTMEFGGAHAVFVGVKEDEPEERPEESPPPVVEEDTDGDSYTEPDSEEDVEVEGTVEEDMHAMEEDMEAAVPLSLDELMAEDERIRDQIGRQQEECQKLLPPEVFEKLATLLTNHEDVDISELAALADPTSHAQSVASKLTGLDVHEYIAVYKLSLYASKLRENLKDIKRCQLAAAGK